MKSRHFVYEMAVLAIVCVIGIFLFPASVGPYPAVHGPVSALQAMRAAMKLRWFMALAFNISCFSYQFSYRPSRPVLGLRQSLYESARRNLILCC